MRQAAVAVHIDVVQPHVACGDAQRGRWPVEDQRPEPVDGQSLEAPAAAAHQELGEVPVLAADAYEPIWSSEISCAAVDNT